MKASVRVREGRRPLVRAKVPVQVGGLPLYSGITVGDERELALHLGTNLEAGPACSLSYRPNDALAPLAVLLKTGFGLWGSPHAAPFTISAEFNLARRENASFMLRLKPRVGSFSFRKHFFSTGFQRGSVRNTGHGVREDDIAGQEEVEVAPGEGMSRPQGDGLVYDTDFDCGPSPLGLGDVSALRTREKKCFMSCEPSSPGSNMELHHVSDETEMSDGVRDADTTEDRRTRWLGHSWGLTVHSTVPLGRQATACVQWGMRVPSRAGDDTGGTFHGHKLPVLVLDKISISTSNPCRKAPTTDNGPLSYTMRYFESPVEDASPLGLIASTCCQMRTQLQSLHLDSSSLKKAIEDMKADMVGQKRYPPGRSTQEEDSIRSQLFEELQKKTSGSRASPKDRLSSSSAPPPESIFDMPSEDLLSEKKPCDLGSKAKAK